MSFEVENAPARTDLAGSGTANRTTINPRNATREKTLSTTITPSRKRDPEFGRPQRAVSYRIARPDNLRIGHAENERALRSDRLLDNRRTRYGSYETEGECAPVMYLL
jgi:hypothetical protein